MKIRYILAMLLASPLRASAVPLTEARFRDLLQGFVSSAHGKEFRHLGDERDFDHGHILSGADGEPAAILWHTQELALYEPAGGEFGYVHPEGRNWLQWISDGRVENARAYERASYPDGATWDWFKSSELPGLKKNLTILDKMLDPRRVAVDPAKTVQWVFTRVDCAGAPASSLRVTLPTREAVCLALSR
ncbi:MAG: hypothetical protein M0D55_05270 [Elusimicrobiota bacterium]|nr:MAG: hypothetical protein M0D55_05270 [Elusimicrobiota bacterium]